MTDAPCVEGFEMSPEPMSYRKLYSLGRVPEIGRSYASGISKSLVIALFTQGSRTYCPRTVPCSVTEYTFHGNHGERWPSTRITIGPYPLHIWEAINPIDEGKRRLFRIHKRIVSRTEGRSFESLLAAVNKPMTTDQSLDAVDLYKRDIKNVDGIQEDGTVIRTTATATLGSKEIGEVEVVLKGDYAYLKKPKKFFGFNVGHSYHEIDLIDFGTFFQPKDPHNAYDIPKNAYGFPLPSTESAQRGPKFDAYNCF